MPVHTRFLQDIGRTQLGQICSVHIHAWLVRSKVHVPLAQSLSARHLSLGVWQKYPWPQLPGQTQGTDFVTPSGPVTEQLSPPSGWQKLSPMHWHAPPRRLGEQKPPGLQSASTRQLLSVAHAFAVVSELDDLQAHGALPVQSESPVHWS